jgi:hypothetical protein
MSMPHANQPDLFAYLTPTVHWSPAHRQMAMMLLQELLQEAVKAPRLSNPCQTGKEGDNEQDHG